VSHKPFKEVNTNKGNTMSKNNYISITNPTKGVKVLIGGEKGGEGKTTIAEGMSSNGYYIIDTDPTGNLSKRLNDEIFPKYEGSLVNKYSEGKAKRVGKETYNSRYKNAAKLSPPAETNRTHLIAEELSFLKSEKFEKVNVVLDSKGADQKDFRTKLKFVDVLVMPVNPSFPAVETALSLLSELSDMNLKVVLVWSRVNKQASTHREVIEKSTPYFKKVLANNEYRILELPFSVAAINLTNRNQLLFEVAFPDGDRTKKPTIGYSNQIEFYNQLHKAVQELGGGK